MNTVSQQRCAKATVNKMSHHKQSHRALFPLTIPSGRPHRQAIHSAERRPNLTHHHESNASQPCNCLSPTHQSPRDLPSGPKPQRALRPSLIYLHSLPNSPPTQLPSERTIDPPSPLDYFTYLPHPPSGTCLPPSPPPTHGSPTASRGPNRARAHAPTLLYGCTCGFLLTICHPVSRSSLRYVRSVFLRLRGSRIRIQSHELKVLKRQVCLSHSSGRKPVGCGVARGGRGTRGRVRVQPAGCRRAACGKSIRAYTPRQLDRAGEMWGAALFDGMASLV